MSPIDNLFVNNSLCPLHVSNPQMNSTDQTSIFYIFIDLQNVTVFNGSWIERGLRSNGVRSLFHIGMAGVNFVHSFCMRVFIRDTLHQIYFWNVFYCSIRWSHVSCLFCSCTYSWCLGNGNPNIFFYERDDGFAVWSKQYLKCIAELICVMYQNT